VNAPNKRPVKAKATPAEKIVSLPAKQPSIYERLAVEFPRDAIHWRALTMAPSGNKALAVGYMDARDVMDRLDHVCTPAGWRNHVSETDKGRIICTLEILVDGEWIGKSDGAGDTAVEGAKGAISDAFKRSAVLWGIGRYLYRLPAVWAPCQSTEKNGKRYFKNWLRSPWDRIPDDWSANTYSDDPDHDPETGVVLETKGLTGISGIKSRLREMKLAGEKVDNLDEFNALVRANKDDLQILKDDNHDWWAGDGIDEEGLKAWILLRRAELSKVDSTTFQLLASLVQESKTIADLQSLLDEHEDKIEELDGDESRRFDLAYNNREAELATSKAPTPLEAGAFGG
jgi:hypothetical protein